MRWKEKHGLSDQALVKAIAEMEQGLIDADLGGSVLKKRVALPGRAKRGGVRVIVATKKVDCWVYLYGFEKNERDNISDRELKIFQEMAGDLLKLNDRQVDLALSEGEFVEVVNETKEKTSRIASEMKDTALGLHRIGLIDKRRMNELEALTTLRIEKMTPEKIKSLREKEHVSQAVFASVLNMSLSTVQKWEIGEKRPSGPSLKLLSLVERKGLSAVL